jgi:ubiquinone/menaquinone biosynthesis C-methylase UbiE
MQIKHETQVKNWFDDWSKSRTFQRLSPWLVYVQEYILNLIEWADILKMLDIGCGSGWAVYEAAKRLEKKSGTIACGCDLSIGMLKKGLKADANTDRACFLSASAQALPFREDSFDVVISTVAFHHFPAPDIALGEFRRVLRAGGRLLIADAFRDISLGSWIFDRLHCWFEDGHIKYYRIAEMDKMLQNAGFANIQVSTINPSFFSTKKIFRRAGIFKAINLQ